jgi:anti-sigma-K factor RskA/putative zinc finger protein
VGDPVSANLEPEHGCGWQLDAAAYVLHALEETEAHAFGEHLASCPGCREEVAQLQSVADALAAGVARASVPQGLGARIMAPVYAEAELLKAAGHEADRVVPARSRRRGLVPAFATAFALGLGLLVGTFAINTGSSERTEVIRAVVVSPGHRATADLREVGSHLQLVVEGMPAPPPGHIYEVWLEHGTEAPVPTDALFSVTKSGDGSVGVPGDLRGVGHVLVTAEPLGGSLKPTRTPVIVAKV